MKEFGARSNGVQKRNGGGYLNFMKKFLPIIVFSLLFCSDGFVGKTGCYVHCSGGMPRF